MLRLSNAEGEGFVFGSKNGLIGVVVGGDIFLAAKNDDCMEAFENESGLEMDYL